MERDLADAFRATEGMISFEEFRLLHELARQVRGGCIVEVGAYRGRSSVALGLGSQDGHQAPVFAIEPHEPFVGVLGGRFGPEDRAAFFRALLETGTWRHVRLVNLSSEVVAPQWTTPVSLLWIDGDHSDAGVRRDFHCWLPLLAADARIAFDDATDPALGPRRLIDHLLATVLFREVQTVGKVAVLARTSSSSLAQRETIARSPVATSTATR